MEQKLLTDNFEMNIWDKLAYDTSNEQSGGWRISAHLLYEDETGYLNAGDFLEDLYIDLTEDEIKRLTLGWDEELGGDYIGDPDFFIDVETFKSIYKDIPERVTDFCNAVIREIEAGIRPFKLVR